MWLLLTGDVRCSSLCCPQHIVEPAALSLQFNLECKLQGRCAALAD
jgi:hypothetical protein